MKKLFDKVTLGSIPVRNRMVRSATFESAADAQGGMGAEIGKIYRDLADGGIGCIITGMVGINEKAPVAPTMVRANTDRFVDDFGKIAADVHKRGAKIVVQISHCGVKAAGAKDGPVGPSDIEVLPGMPARALTREEIAETVRDFAATALNCKKAGADGVQIHGAHGYLLSEFLSPFFNHRQDEYGGSIENRSRIVMEVYDAVRATVGEDYPVWIKINSEDFLENGLSFADSAWVCRELEKRGLDAVELSGGAGGAPPESRPSRLIREESDEGSFARQAILLAEQLKIPVISVGGYRTPDIAEDWLNKGNIEALSLCRPLISEPGLAARWLSGDRGKARCISCNKCFRPKNGFGCQAFPEAV